MKKSESVGCLVTALRKGGKHALTGSASGTNSVILKNLYFLTRNDPFFHAVLWGRGHPDPRTLKLLERPFFAPCYGGGHHPDPRPKHPDPRLWLGFLTQLNRGPGGPKWCCNKMSQDCNQVHTRTLSRSSNNQPSPTQLRAQTHTPI